MVGAILISSLELRHLKFSMLNDSKSHDHEVKLLGPDPKCPEPKSDIQTTNVCLPVGAEEKAEMCDMKTKDHKARQQV